MTRFWRRQHEEAEAVARVVDGLDPDPGELTAYRDLARSLRETADAAPSSRRREELRAGFLAAAARPRRLALVPAVIVAVMLAFGVTAVAAAPPVREAAGEVLRTLVDAVRDEPAVDSLDAVGPDELPREPARPQLDNEADLPVGEPDPASTTPTAAPTPGDDSQPPAGTPTPGTTASPAPTPTPTTPVVPTPAPTPTPTTPVVPTPPVTPLPPAPPHPPAPTPPVQPPDG
jgi:hypothetical protein